MRRWLRASLLLSLVVVLVVPLVPYALQQQGDGGALAGRVPVPGADLWRAVRQREGPVQGVTQVQGVDSGVLIHTGGEGWRRFRSEVLIPWGAGLMGLVLALILLFYLVRGPIPIPGGRSGRTVRRFEVNEIVLHWAVVVVFWILGLSGLTLLYGRLVLIPLLGPEGFSPTASAAKEAHNLFGPVFLVLNVALFLVFFRDNLPGRGDWDWLRRAGGMFGGGHAHAGRFNAGEKIWFWLATLGGMVIAVTGLILDFPVFGQGRVVMTGSHVLHAGFALLVIAVSFGHTYLATIGLKGSLESMTRGTVDANWARAHHDLWYERLERSGKVQAGGQAGPAGTGAGPEAGGGATREP